MKKEFIKRAIKGDPEAIAKLVAQYQEAIYRWAFNIVKNAEDARDIVQEVVIKIITHLASLQKVSKLTQWIYRITYHLSLNWLRLTKRLIPLNEIEITDNVNFVLQHQKEEDIFQLNKALKELPHLYREIITLYYFEGFSYQEIAKMLNLPIGTVKTNLYRAKKMLKAKLSAEQDRMLFLEK